MDVNSKGHRGLVPKGFATVPPPIGYCPATVVLNAGTVDETSHSLASTCTSTGMRLGSKQGSHDLLVLLVIN